MVASRRDMVRSEYHSLSTDESGPRSRSARPSRKREICLATGFCGLFSTVFVASSLLCTNPTKTVTTFLENHEQIFPSSAETFIRIAENVDVDGAFDYSALAALCRNTTWRDGLVFRLADTTGGGMGNVKVTFLNSLRFAIEAGGKSNPRPRQQSCRHKHD